MTDIKSLTLSELQEEMERLGEKRFRAGQIYSWLHEKLADDFQEMTNLSGALRERLEQEYELIRLPLVKVQTSVQDGTSKFLFRLGDGSVIESVLMRITTAIPSVYPLRQAAGWAAGSVHPHWTV